MSLDAAFLIARSGLRHIDRQLARGANDIANAAVEGHSRTSLAGRALEARGAGMGVRSGVVARDVDLALAGAIDRARSAEAAAALTGRLLAGVEAAHGDPEADESLAGRLAGLRAGFIAAHEAPADLNRRMAVLAEAEGFVIQGRAVADAVLGARQQAHDALVQEVAGLNADLNEIARLSTEVVREQASGRSTAALEDRRDLLVGRLAERLEVTVLRASSGAVTLVARGGLVLPLAEQGAALAVAPATLGPGSHPAAGLPGVLLAGQDVTARLSGGRIGAAVALRDTTLPRMQAEIDLLAAEVASRFAAQGLRLFTDAAGAVPDVTLSYDTGGQLGFARSMRVNPDIVATPRLLRDGTDAVAGLPGGPTAFTPNPAGGPAGFDTLLLRVLDHVFTDIQAPGLAQAEIAASGLGPDGGLTSALTGFRTIEGYAAALIAEQSAAKGGADAAEAQAAQLREVLAGRVAERSGVDPDAEMATMVELQNAYATNARVMAAVQSMWDALLGAVR
jgi:flagellar hook-associated protein 1 FlgK